MMVGKDSLLVFFALIIVAIGCRKDPADMDSGGNSIEELVKDTAWSYARDIYLWYQHLPERLNLKSYTDPDALMKAVRSYSMEPGFSEPVDRWSFAMKKRDWDDVSQGVSGDFGLGIFFKSQNDLRVSYVEPASPAAAAGIQRSWRILSVNQNGNISTDEATIARIIDAFYNKVSVSVGFEKPDGSTINVTLHSARYVGDPVILDTVYHHNGNKIGYFVYNSFLGDVNEMKSRLADVFTGFSAEAITDLIVDLRYNGGGFVELQNELANYLVPAAEDGKVMLREEFNDKYSSLFDTTIFFQKKGLLDMSRIFFIITGNTASASELLINSLKPYMDVKLVGHASHGKPVGYFNIGVGDWYIFPVSFRSVNNNGEGNYFNGLQPDALVNDGLDKSWGDVNEDCLASVLQYIQDGVFRRVSTREQHDDLLDRGNSLLDVRRFKGAIERKGLLPGRHLQDKR
ncbi:MAG: hypothetical protein H3C48_09430 [Chitinophagaceae bacterium]|nr:hypothetical protein [Chitinophagaceae bacterium]